MMNRPQLEGPLTTIGVVLDELHTASKKCGPYYSPDMFRYLLICLILFTGSAHAPPHDFDAVKKAAEQGHADAQYNLGVMYANGDGVPEDYAEAVRWFRKAAEQGDALAQARLGVMYATGEGVPEDVIQAYAWISLASAQGVENAKEAKEILTGEMTRAEIAEAQKLSRKYWNAFGPGLNTQ